MPMSFSNLAVLPTNILHTSLFAGYFAKEGIKVAILEPNDTSDVTELIGSGKADLGCKAMIHTLAGKARGFPIKSIGTLMDEPFTGVIYLEGSGITSDFKSLKGKRIGYVGEFGKIQIDELTKYYGMTSEDYTAVRCGMNVSKGIIEGTIDAGIGLENIQQVELEEWCKANNRPASDVKMLRIDELAELGCCCFCSILYIANEDWLKAHPKEAGAFMRAVKAGADDMFADPRASWAEYCKVKPVMNTPLNRLMFDRSFNYMSQDLSNVSRDWNKVTNYSKRLEIVPADFVANYTNEFVQWEVAPEGGEAEGLAKQQEIKALQAHVAQHGGVLQATVA
ncbi:protein NMT1, variant [Puccinia graminis f. sp. tritici CRL 75-36-700-3]|uniref:4-amino-5-hydroxymethyl-2-methylpyrimidine phosphate synthase n=1 Tax=Puccinia graminis f. sp. tritici (strain CRL 75-36-700-3 / race SCCL) TaxID=418459 RepID=H6QS81_PUCGT|nr:protein NMT1, variant [Puccinia graminis f. sp. tritici CRL 75-36-700-3]EHS63546.1 protein NMT1, variant [Puccinia graminis f. sp. tritici CRL 75-36-700-3]